MMQYKKHRLKHAIKGVAMVEFAIILPLLLFILLIAIDFGRFGYTTIAVSNAARGAALSCIYTPVDACAADAATVISKINTAVQNEGASYIQLGSAGSGVSVTFPTAEIPYLDIEVSHVFKTIISWPAIPREITIKRRAKTPVGLGKP